MALLKAKLRARFSRRKEIMDMTVLEAESYVSLDHYYGSRRYTITFKEDGVVCETVRYARTECSIHNLIIACNKTKYFKYCSNFKLSKIGD